MARSRPRPRSRSSAPSTPFVVPTSTIGSTVALLRSAVEDGQRRTAVLAAQLAQETEGRTLADHDAATLREQVRVLHGALETARRDLDLTTAALHVTEAGAETDRHHAEALAVLLAEEVSDLACSSPLLESAIRTVLGQAEVVDRLVEVLRARRTENSRHPSLPGPDGFAIPRIRPDTGILRASSVRPRGSTDSCGHPIGKGELTPLAHREEKESLGKGGV
jgi:hypothetical protein